jgi:ribosome-associated protein
MTESKGKAKAGAKKTAGAKKAAVKRKPAAAAKTPAAASRSSAGKAAAPKKAAAPESAAKRVALAIAEAGLDKKAVNVEIIDVLGKVDYADYLVVMSGRSDRQVAALARGIEEDVEAKTKTKCLGVEGVSQGRWVLMDFGDVVVHIFHEDVRGYYDLESLWMDAARVPVAVSN